MQPYFSILIPVYNQKDKMDDCIASLKRQTFTDFDVIFVNDGSTDDSQAMLEAFCKEDPRFSVCVHEKNSSLTAARYTGMQHADGKYVIFLDSDDWLDDDTCECLKERLDREPVELLRYGYVEEPSGRKRPPADDHGDPVNAQMTGLIPPQLVKNCCSAALIKRVLERVKPFYCNMSEDVFWSSVLFTSAKSFGTIDRMFYHYMLGTGMSTQLTTTPAAFERSVKSILDMSRELYAYMEKWAPKYLDLAHSRISTALRYTLTNAVFPETDFYAIAEMLNSLRREEARDLYEDACRDLLPLTARRIWGVSNELMQKMGLEAPPMTWFKPDYTIA